MLDHFGVTVVASRGIVWRHRTPYLRNGADDPGRQSQFHDKEPLYDL